MKKKIGFLSFGHWRAVEGSQTRTAAEALRQTIELTQAAEEIGIDGAYVRVHHFERQLASPFPLLAGMAARTSRIEIGTAVIDMRYENPLYRQAWAARGWTREPRVSVSRSVLPITSDLDRAYFGGQGHEDQIGLLEGVRSRFGRTFAGEPDRIAAELAADEAVRAADTVLLTVPNQLGVAYNARILDTIARYVAPAIGWTPAQAATAA